MRKENSSRPTVCVLTQTASDVSPFYREFFAGLDLFFVTFKREHPDAVDFLPGSTWSDGRNRLWEHVKGRYDYYLFLDDDLDFYCLPNCLPTALGRLFQMKEGLQEKLRLREIAARGLGWFSFRKASPDRFRRLLFENLKKYRPHVSSVALTWDADPFPWLDRYAWQRSRRARPLGWFDAHVTIFSSVGARLLLPYDTHFSGWWSAQIPIYVLAHLAFQERSVNFIDLAVRNAQHTPYRPGYDGFEDCRLMSEWLSRGITDPACDAIYRRDGVFVDFDFAQEFAKRRLVPAPPGDETLETVLMNLGGSFDLHHPYIYERHRETVDALGVKSSGPARKEVYG